jgi:hypothetical protein
MNDAKPNPSDDKEIKGGKGRWITPEEYATLTPLGLSYIRHLCSKNCEKWRCASRFDERDLKRFSKSKVLIWYMPRNPASGENYPRIVERPEDPPSIIRGSAKK